MNKQRDIATIERVRQLGATEYILDTMEQQASGHLVRVIDVEGPIEAGLLESAFRRLVARRPILRTRIERPPGERPIFVLDDGVTPEFSVVERAGPEHWVREFDGQLNTRISGDGDAAVRARVLASDGTGGEIIVSAAHSVCDGKSLFAFCRDLLDEYEALRAGDDGSHAVAPGVIRSPIEALLPEWLSGSRLQETIDGFVARQAATAADVRVMFPIEHNDSTVASTSHALFYTVPAAETATLRRLARDNGASVTSAVAAVLIQALADIARPPADHWIVPAVTIDLRAQLRESVPLADMGMYAGTIFSKHSAVDAMAPWDLAREVRTQLATSLDHLDQLVMVLLGERFVDQFVTADRPICPLTLANLGSVELSSDRSTLRPRSIRGGAPIHAVKYPGVFCQTVTISGVLWVTLVYVTPQLRPGGIARDFGASALERLLWLARPSR